MQVDSGVYASHDSSAVAEMSACSDLVWRRVMGPRTLPIEASMPVKRASVRTGTRPGDVRMVSTIERNAFNPCTGGGH